jgi:hypothetical protein
MSTLNPAPAVCGATNGSHRCQRLTHADDDHRAYSVTAGVPYLHIWGGGRPHTSHIVRP